MQYIFYGKCSIYSMAGEVYIPVGGIKPIKYLCVKSCAYR